MKEEINKTLIKKVVLRNIKDELLNITRYRSENNLVYLLKFKNADKVIKIDTSKEHWKIEKEIYIYSLLKKESIPVPNIICYDLGFTVIPYQWYIMEKIGDINLNEIYARDKKGSKALFFELGCIFAKIHNIHFSKQGEISKEKIEEKSFYDIKRESLEKDITNLKKKNLISEEDCKKVLEIFETIPLNKECSLCHEDYGPWQAIVNNNKITGIIDWEWARSSDPLYDFAKARFNLALWSGNLDYFDKGYWSIRPMDDKGKLLLIKYMVVSALSVLAFFAENENNFNMANKKFKMLIDAV